jgi:hypothetical protein
MNKELYQEKLKTARLQGGPVLIPASLFNKPRAGLVMKFPNSK